MYKSSMQFLLLTKKLMVLKNQQVLHILLQDMPEISKTL